MAKRKASSKRTSHVKTTRCKESQIGKSLKKRYGKRNI